MISWIVSWVLLQGLLPCTSDRSVVQVWFRNYCPESGIRFKMPGMSSSKRAVSDSVVLNGYFLQQEDYLYELWVYDFSAQLYDFDRQGFLDPYRELKEQRVEKQGYTLLEENTLLYMERVPAKHLTLSDTSATGKVIRAEKRFLFAESLAVEMSIRSVDTLSERFERNRQLFFESLQYEADSSFSQ